MADIRPTLTSWRRYIQADVSDSPSGGRRIRADRETPGEDRISSLSDDVLLQILGQLPLFEVMRTSCLSKRWCRLWTSLPVLSFTEHMFQNSPDILVSVVDSMIRRYSPISIRQFSLELNSWSRSYHSKLPDWLTFAVDHSVKEFILDVHPTTSFTLPSRLCVNSCVLRLQLTCSKFVTPASFVWTSLKCLTLIFICLSNTRIEEILAGCPSLEKLRIIFCSNYTRLDFSDSTSLRKLVVQGDSNLPLTIRGPPNLRSFKLSEILFAHKTYCLENLNSVVEADLTADFTRQFRRQNLPRSIHFTPPFRGHYNLLRSVISAVCLVEKLTLTLSCLEVLSWLEDNSLPCLSHLAHLVVDTHFAESDVIGLIRILKHSPNIKSFSLKLNHQYGLKCGGNNQFWDKEESVENFRMSQVNGDFKCLSLHLKTVTVDRLGLYQCEDRNLIQFMGILLKNALVLEELSIISSDPIRERDERQFRDTTLALLNLPTSSPNVKIKLS